MFSMKHAKEYCYSRRIGCSALQGYPQQYVPSTHLYIWVDTKWSKVPCLRKQRDRRGLNHGPQDPECEVLTARQQTPPQNFLLEKISKSKISNPKKNLLSSPSLEIRSTPSPWELDVIISKVFGITTEEQYRMCHLILQ